MLYLSPNEIDKQLKGPRISDLIRQVVQIDNNDPIGIFFFSILN